MTNVLVVEKRVVLTDDTGSKRVINCYSPELAALYAAAIRERLEAPKPLTFSQFIPKWKKYHAQVRMTPTSLACYESIIDTRLVPYFGDVLLHDVDEQMVRAFIRQELDLYQRGRSVSPDLMKLQAVLGLAAKWGYIEYNPVREIDGIFLGVCPEPVAAPLG